MTVKWVANRVIATFFTLFLIGQRNDGYCFGSLFSNLPLLNQRQGMVDFACDGFHDAYHHAVAELLVDLSRAGIQNEVLRELHQVGTLTRMQLADNAVNQIGTCLGRCTATVGGQRDANALRGINAVALTTFTHRADTNRL